MNNTYRNRIRPIAISIIRKNEKILVYQREDDKTGKIFFRLVGGCIGFSSFKFAFDDKFEISMKSFKKEEESKTDSWEDDVVKIHLDQHEKIKNFTRGKIITTQKTLATARKNGDTFQAINAIKGKDNARNHPIFDWLQALSQ